MRQVLLIKSVISKGRYRAMGGSGKFTVLDTNKDLKVGQSVLVINGVVDRVVKTASYPVFIV